MSRRHRLGSSDHVVDTLANVNAMISDANLIDTADSRLSDARTPTSHASTHQNGGGDEIATTTPTANSIPKTAGLTTLDEDWYPDVGGATSGSAGTKGAVPQPTAGQQDYILSGGGVWQAPATLGDTQLIVDVFTDVATGTRGYVRVPQKWAAKSLISASVGVFTAGVGGGTDHSTYQITKRPKGTTGGSDVDLFSTVATVEDGEYDSVDGTPPVVKTDGSEVLAEGDWLLFKCVTQAAATAPKGLSFSLQFSGTAGATGNMVLVEEKVVTSALTTYTFTPTLNGDVDGQYIVEANIINDAASATTYLVQFNGADIVAVKQILHATSTTVAASLTTSNTFATYTNTASQNAAFTLNLLASRSGYDRFALLNSVNASVPSPLSISLSTVRLHLTTPSSGTNITSIGVRSTVANGLGVGTVLRLWKRRL